MMGFELLALAHRMSEAQRRVMINGEDGPLTNELWFSSEIVTRGRDVPQRRWTPRGRNVRAVVMRISAEDYSSADFARAIVQSMKLTHHRVAKDARAYLVGGKPALWAEFDKRGLDKRARTRAERSVTDYLRKLALVPDRLHPSWTTLDDARVARLRDAVVAILKEA